VLQCADVRAHVAAGALAPRGGFRRRPGHRHKASTRKIDLAVAPVMAVDRATVASPTYNVLDSVW